MNDAMCGTIAPEHSSDVVSYARDTINDAGVLWSFLGPVETAADMADAPG